MLRSQLAIARPLIAPAVRAHVSKTNFQHVLIRSLETDASASSSSGPSRIRSGLLSTVLLLGTGAFLVYAHDSRAGVHRWIGLPIIHALTANDPEKAHEIAVDVVGSGFAPVDCVQDSSRLQLDLWGKHFSNPIGMAAGFDKHAQAIDGLFKLGFGYVEIGSITPQPQSGNPKPRVFRVPETQSLVNRYGFNSEGHSAVIARLRRRVQQFISLNASILPSSLFPTPPLNASPDYDVVSQFLASPSGKDALAIDTLGLPRSLREGHVLGINLGKNKTSGPDSVDDFVDGVKVLGPYADVLIVNVSSPNTPGLRALQSKGMLEELLGEVVTARDALTSTKPPILVKVAPDLNASELRDVAHAVKSTGVNGIIVSNTTISRPESAGDNYALSETGGLSGPPVKPLALAALSCLYEETEGKIPLIGCGGISTGQDALDFARAGASLVQLYTSFAYEGFGLPRKIKDQLTEILDKENTTWTKNIGISARSAVEVLKAADAKKASVKPEEVVERDSTKREPTNANLPMSEDEFTFALQDAKRELDELLKELANVSPAQGDKAETFSQKTPLTEVFEKPLHSQDVSGESLNIPHVPIQTHSRDASSSESIKTAMPVTSSTQGVNATRSQQIDLSPLAVPANAILNQDQVATLLDPAKAQVDAQELEVKKETEKFGRPVSGGGPRWV